MHICMHPYMCRDTQNTQNTHTKHTHKTHTKHTQNTHKTCTHIYTCTSILLLLSWFFFYCFYFHFSSKLRQKTNERKQQEDVNTVLCNSVGMIREKLTVSEGKESRCVLMCKHSHHLGLRFKLPAFHKPNLILQIKLMRSSTFESIKFD